MITREQLLSNISMGQKNYSNFSKVLGPNYLQIISEIEKNILSSSAIPYEYTFSKDYSDIELKLAFSSLILTINTIKGSVVTIK